MKVRELVERLQKMDPECEVAFIDDEYGIYWRVNEVEQCKMLERDGEPGVYDMPADYMRRYYTRWHETTVVTLDK